MQLLNFELKNQILLAPLAGITDLAFRMILREKGISLAYSEMISAKALCYQDKKTRELLKTNEYDSPLCVQLFGSEPDILARAAVIIEDMGFKAIDINMGCPAPKITSNGEGSALMKTPDLIGKLVEATVSAVKIPVSVKMRAGYTKDTINAPECAKIAENAGASAICIHGRTREEFYSGVSNWDIIKEVKENAKIPVIGNGDIRTPEDAKRMLSYTGCDFIMLARGTLGNPHLAEQIDDFLKNGTYNNDITLKDKIDTLKKHIDLMIEFKNERTAVIEFRKHLAWYLKGIRNSKKYREEANHIKTIGDVNVICDAILQDFDLI